MEILTSPDFWKIAVPALAAIIAWFFNERTKLVWEQYKRKEENYKELLRCIRGFYVSSQDAEVKAQYVHQSNVLWLYAPDHVVQANNAFLDKVQTGAPDKELAFGEVVLLARKDLLSREIVRDTKLTANDFRHFTST